MNLKPSSILIAIFAVSILHPVNLTAQARESGSSTIKEGVGRTWKGPKINLLAGILKPKQAPKQSGGRVYRKLPARAAPAVETAAVTFKPVGDSGVAKDLADTFGGDPAEKAALLEAFNQIKQGYDTEVAKEGKSNDLAAAMTFFIAANVTAFHQSEMPSDAASESLYESLRSSMPTTPEFAKLSNTEKQQMHDWLVCMGGFVIAGYLEAKQSADTEGLGNFTQIADQSMRVALGVEVGKLQFGPTGLIAAN